MTDWAARYGWGARWLRQNNKEVSEAGARVAELVDWVWDGIYHCEGATRAAWNGDRVAVVVRAPHFTSNLTTFDGSLLTKLVIGAHDHAIRVGVSAVSPTYVKFDFWPRARNEHPFSSHPKLEERLTKWERPFRFEDAPVVTDAAVPATRGSSSPALNAGQRESRLD